MEAALVIAGRLAFSGKNVQRPKMHHWRRGIGVVGVRRMRYRQVRHATHSTRWILKWTQRFPVNQKNLRLQVGDGSGARIGSTRLGKGKGGSVAAPMDTAEVTVEEDDEDSEEIQEGDDDGVMLLNGEVGEESSEEEEEEEEEKEPVPAGKVEG